MDVLGNVIYIGGFGDDRTGQMIISEVMKDDDI